MAMTVYHTMEYPWRSVDVIVPLIIELLDPKSVVDFGCNVGCWLDRFRRNSVIDICGIDGEYISESDLLIPKENYISFNLNDVRELKLERQFDLALCLECAEHLEPSSAEDIVETLCKSAPHVVFSAAVPGQTGMGHKNEQYPDFWQALFARQGYEMFDAFRPQIWKREEVDFWYRQNLFLFSKSEKTFNFSVPKWDGRFYVARELLEIYVQALDSVNQQEIIRLDHIERLLKQLKPPLTRRILGRLRRPLRRLKHFVNSAG